MGAFAAVLENACTLLTPGPLTTSEGVRQAMQKDWCTWDEDYLALVRDIRGRLSGLASADPRAYTAVLLQGSGTYGVESVLGTAIPPAGKLLVLANGAYGQRIGMIARTLGIRHTLLEFPETSPIDLVAVDEVLSSDPGLTHVAAVHVETTTGLVNPVQELGRLVRESGRSFILDAMSSFGGIPMDLREIGVDFAVTSANKCLQGTPGFCIVLARPSALEAIEGQARSLSLDLHDQWRTMEAQGGKWRFTSPTHAVCAFHKALLELEEEGGIPARHRRFCENQALVAEGMTALGFRLLISPQWQSPIITTFLVPDDLPGFEFSTFYRWMKQSGFLIYPGKLTQVDSFRIGNIGHVNTAILGRFLEAAENCLFRFREQSRKPREGERRGNE